MRGKNVYCLALREGTAEANLSLQKLLEERYGRELTNFEADDETLASIEGYLKHTQSVIDGLKRWSIRRWLALGHFAFGRFLMYIDLNPKNWRQHPSDHPLVNAILSGWERGEDGSLGPPIPHDYPIDEPDIENIAPLLIQDADASQHSALIDMMRERNLVIQGPPGTGKSQTIANMIANAIAAGKRVLFLAEKQAALDVVKRRLDKAGLGDFCLELHSDKASPKSVVESLKARRNLGWGQTSRPALASAPDLTLHENRNAIVTYLNALHTECPDGRTPFALMWQAIRGRAQDADVIEAFDRVDIPSALVGDARKLNEIGGQVAVFAATAATFTRNFGHPAQSPWSDIPVAPIPSYEIRPLISMLTELRKIGVEIANYLERYANLGIETVPDIERLIAVDSTIGNPAEDALISTIAALDLGELEAGLAIKRKLIEIEAILSSKPDLSDEPPTRLSLATTLVRSQPPPAYLEKTPAKAYALATDTIGQLSSVLKTVEGCLPIVGLLRLDRAFPSKGLAAVAMSAVLAGEIASQQRHCLGKLVNVDEAALEAAYSQWSKIAAADFAWRQKLKPYGRTPWPTAVELQTAAATLRKGLVGRAFGAVTGSTRAARQLTLRLGFGDPLSSLDDLDQLVGHVQALVDFENDREIASLIGTSWQGVGTPFEEIAGGIRTRAFIRRTIAALPEGERVATRVISMTSDELGALGGLAPAGRIFRVIADELKHIFGERPIEVLISEINVEIGVLQRLLNIDCNRLLLGLDVPIREISEIFELLSQRERFVQTLSKYPIAHAVEELGRSFTEIDRVCNAIKWIQSVDKAGAPPRLFEVLTSPIASEARGILREAASSGAVLCRSFLPLIEKVTREFGITGLQNLTPSTLVKRLDLLLAHQAELADFMALREQRYRLVDAGLSDILAGAEHLRLPPDRFPRVFETLVSERRADDARRCSPALCQNGPTLEARRQTFADRDRKKIAAGRSVVREQLLKPTPFPGSNSGPKKTWTEMALLTNEFGKQRRFTALRDLLSRAGLSIEVLKPCFMMSPLSLAKFLKPGAVEFDLLIIDEASQMRPEDALGGMLRAKQIVVVGDPKQLPPTDFFMRSADEISLNDEFEDVDAESILEACQKTFREVRRLKWHYRSRCESLIAFSNAEFYDRSLITFPTARPGSFAIDLVRVAGVYQARRNVAEAVCVAEQAVQFMRHHAEMEDETVPTLGLVAINTDQRDLIQEELRRLCAGDQLVDRYQEKVEKKGEPVFVKNLENVQGDERDYIFISLTYGREPTATAMKQRFGPINGKQGHRRLNVLFSRARIRIGLFASFGSGDVNPSATSAEGMRVLKRYLEYAENRGRAAVESIGSEADSDFEVEVANRLRGKGYEVDVQVGVSGYKIDLGIRHPDHPERFLAGIECDGARYHSSKSARDRDRLREEVLRGLGWEILRVWSTDWFDNPGLETEKLSKRLEQLRSHPRHSFENYYLVREVASAPQHDPVGEPGLPVVATPALENKPLAVTSTPKLAISGVTSLLAGDGPLSEEQAFEVLKEFRETVIKPEMTVWEPHRSMLRDGMIETFVRQRITDPEDWFRKVPQFQRAATNPLEKRLFLSRVCEIIERISDDEPAVMTAGVQASAADLSARTTRKPNVRGRRRSIQSDPYLH